MPNRTKPIDGQSVDCSQLTHTTNCMNYINGKWCVRFTGLTSCSSPAQDAVTVKSVGSIAIPTSATVNTRIAAAFIHICGNIKKNIDSADSVCPKKPQKTPDSILLCFVMMWLYQQLLLGQVIHSPIFFMAASLTPIAIMNAPVAVKLLGTLWVKSANTKHQRSKTRIMCIIIVIIVVCCSTYTGHRRHINLGS